MHAVLYYSNLNKYIPTDMMNNQSENDEENSTKRKYTYTLNIYGYKWILNHYIQDYRKVILEYILEYNCNIFISYLS